MMSCGRDLVLIIQSYSRTLLRRAYRGAGEATTPGVTSTLYLQQSMVPSSEWRSVLLE